MHDQDGQSIWILYEEKKKQLQKLDLTHEEYQRLIKQLTDELKI